VLSDAGGGAVARKGCGSLTGSRPVWREDYVIEHLQAADAEQQQHQ
jgi:hypothetical protein